MEKTEVKVALPQEPNQKFALNGLVSYLDSEYKANETVRNLIDVNCSDVITIDMVATALYHNRYERQFLELLSNFTEKSLKGGIILGVHKSLYHLQKCINGENVAENDSAAKDSLQKALLDNYQYSLVWLGKCFYELKNGDYVHAAEYLSTAMNCQNQTINEPVFQTINEVYRLGPLYQIAAGFIDYFKGEYNTALNKFIDAAKVSIRSTPLIRLAIGMCLYQQNKWPEAMIAFKRCLEIDPRNTTAMMMLAQIQFPEGSELVTKALEIEPNNDPIKLFRTYLAFWARRPKIVIKEVTAIIKGQTLDNQPELLAEALFQVGRARHSLGDLQKAQQLYETAAQTNPRHFRAQYGVSHLALAQGDYSTPIERLEGCIKEIYDSYEAHAVLGMAYASQFKASRSIEDAEKSRLHLMETIKLLKDREYSDLYKIHLTLGWINMKMLSFDEAHNNFNKAISLIEAAGLEVDDQTLFFLGISQFQLERFPEALQTYRRIGAKDNAILRFNVALCQERIGQTDEARDEYERLIDEYPLFPEPYLRRGCLYMDEADIQHAQECFEFVSEHCPAQRYRAQLYIAELNRRKKDYAGVVSTADSIERETDLKDGRITALVMHGNALLQYGQRKTDPDDIRKYLMSARDFFAKALRLDHKCVAAASGLAITWLLLGHKKEARDNLQIVKENQPRLAGPAENLAYAYLAEENYSQAANEFEECNRQHYDRTNPILLRCTCEAYKFEGQFDKFLDAAENLCLLEPGNPNNWLILSSAIQKVVQNNSRTHNIEQRKPRPDVIKGWLKLAKLSAKLLRRFIIANPTANPRKYEEKADDIEKRYIPYLMKQLKRALEREKQNNERIALDARAGFEDDGIHR